MYSTVKEIEKIRQGDVVYSLNGDAWSCSLRIGVYFMTTDDIDAQKDALKSAMEWNKPFSVKLIRLMDYM